MTHYVLPETKTRIRYDKEVRGLYVYISGLIAEGSVADTMTMSDSPLVNFDYNADGSLIGVEILLPR